MATPGGKATFKHLGEDKPVLKDLLTAFRGAAGHGNYLAADCIDGQTAFNEVCRWMASLSLPACQSSLSGV